MTMMHDSVDTVCRACVIMDSSELSQAGKQALLTLAFAFA